MSANYSGGSDTPPRRALLPSGVCRGAPAAPALPPRTRNNSIHQEYQTEPIKEPDEQQRQDPNLRADLALYDALIASELPGKVYFDLNMGQQVDIFAWMPGQGRYALEAKGSLHWLDNGQWRYLDRNHIESEARPAPPNQARTGALAASDALKDRLNGHKPWIHAVLVLTDVNEPDADIHKFAEDHHVHVIWGLRDIEGQLKEITSRAPDYHPPTELDLEAEAAAFDYRDPPPNWQPPRTEDEALRRQPVWTQRRCRNPPPSPRTTSYSTSTTTER